MQDLLKKKKPNLTHWLCVDNDTAGNKFIFQRKSEDQSIKLFQPPKKYKDQTIIKAVP